MTSLAAEPTIDSMAALHACIERLASPDMLGPAARSAALESVARAKARLAAYELRLLAAADRDRDAQKAGHANTSQWAAQSLHADLPAMARQVRLSRRLEDRTTTQVALAAGELSAEHAAVIVRADEQLPADLGPVERLTVERALVEKARTMSPMQLRKAARRSLGAVERDVAVVDAHENEIVRDLEENARRRTRLTLHDNEDGTVTGHFTVPVLHGHLLRKIVETITAPRRGRLGAAQAQVGDNTGLRTDWDRARGEALVELIEHLPTDHLHPKTAATVIVTTELNTLRDALKVAGLDTGESLSAAEVRRLACNARLVPAVLGGASVPLDLGRSARLFSNTQRLAVGIAHKTCIAEGCDRSAAWCELHHDDPWAHGGRTDLDKAVPACHFHHRRLHDPRYRNTRAPDGSIRFRLRT
jgi:hypothetical protein